jgi:hypothetical protein
MKDLIYKFLEKSIQSLLLYESAQEKKIKATVDNPSRLKSYQVIADNCIQMAAVNWCKVFGSKKSKMYYATDKNLDKKLFLSFVEARDASFQEIGDKMRSFRDKYGEGNYSQEEVNKLFKQALDVIDAYEHVLGERSLMELYRNASMEL